MQDIASLGCIRWDKANASAIPDPIWLLKYRYRETDLRLKNWTFALAWYGNSNSVLRDRQSTGVTWFGSMSVDCDSVNVEMRRGPTYVSRCSTPVHIL